MLTPKLADLRKACVQQFYLRKWCLFKTDGCDVHL
jgi:hypothetical protein